MGIKTLQFWEKLDTPHLTLTPPFLAIYGVTKRHKKTGTERCKKNLNLRQKVGLTGWSLLP